MPVSWKGTLIQYAGRLHRQYPGKSEVRIVDYVDRRVPMLARMFERRQRGYRSIGYGRDEEAGVGDDAVAFAGSHWGSWVRWAVCGAGALP